MPTARYAPGHGRAGAAHPATGGKAPHRRRSSGIGGANDGGPLADPVPVEEFSPPPWRTVFNSRADLGELVLLASGVWRPARAHACVC